MLQVNTPQELTRHPKISASWEGFALEKIIRHYKVRDEEAYFWATHGEAELDLLLFHRGKRLGFKFKISHAPTITKSMHIAIKDLKLDHLYIICQGEKSYSITDLIKVIGLQNMTRDLPLS